MLTQSNIFAEHSDGTRTAETSSASSKRIFPLIKRGVAGVVACGLVGTMLTGCSAADSFTGSSSTDTSTLTIVSDAYELTLGATNSFCNGALQISFDAVQRRPISIFEGASISGSSSSSSVSATSSSEIAIQVDVSFTWNVNTYNEMLTAAGNSSASPSTLSDLLQPGELMYIQGTDADGNTYLASDLVIPSTSVEDNELATTSTWDYSVINTSLPETSVSQSGSIIFRVASTAQNLELVIITPTGGQDASNGADIMTSGSYAIYILPLS